MDKNGNKRVTPLSMDNNRKHLSNIIKIERSNENNKKCDNYNIKQLSFINTNNSSNTTYQDFLNIHYKKII